MAKKPSINNITTGYTSAEAINENFQNVRDAFDNTLSLDGSTPNAMNADLDMNGNSIINADTILVGGTDYLVQALAAKTAAEAAQTGAETAETNAEAAEAAALVSETNAASSASSASTSETNAAASETASASSASAAALSASSASVSASSASTSASNASTSESNAATSASNASSSASAASSSASSAASSASSAQASADAALSALDDFDDRYLGQKTSDPTLDNDGNALVAGALYFNTTDNAMKVYDGSQWLSAYASLTGVMLSANNLSDLDDVPTARTNLGLGTAATTASTDYATAAQGTNADTAYGWGNHASAGYLTSYTETDPIYTASSWYSTTNNSSNWDTAYGWGDHAAAGYTDEALALAIALG